MLNYMLIHKYVIVGDHAVGKSSIAQKFVHNYCRTEPTIGVDFFARQLDHYKIHIWDTAGLEQYRSITQSYFRGANAVLIVATSSDTLNEWYQQAITMAPPNAKIFIIRNKIDRELNNSVERWAIDNKLPFFETTIKDYRTIENLFRSTAKELEKDLPMELVKLETPVERWWEIKKCIII